MNFRSYLFLTFLMITLLGCEDIPATYTEDDPEIHLETIRQQDSIGSTYFGMSSKDGRFWDNVYPEVIGFPDSLDEVKVYYKWLDDLQALYQTYKRGLVPQDKFDYYSNNWGGDTTSCISDFVSTFVIVGIGTAKSGKSYYFYDSDNDLDLADEQLYEIIVSETNDFGNNNTEFQPHKVVYEKAKNKKIEKDSTWIALFEHENRVLLQFCEKGVASFKFDTTNYSIEVRPSISHRYKSSTSYTIMNQDNGKAEEYYVNEYVKLGNTYYQISCSEDGSMISIIKEENALDKGSTQIGMPPIPFSATSLAGETVDFPSNHKGKFVLLDFWSLGCAPCIYEMKNYYIDIYEKYGEENLEIIGIADNTTEEITDFISDNGIKWTIVADGNKRNIQKKYSVYYWPTVYLIDPSGRIILKDMDVRGRRLGKVLDQKLQKNNAG